MTCCGLLLVVIKLANIYDFCILHLWLVYSVSIIFLGKESFSPLLRKICARSAIFDFELGASDYLAVQSIVKVHKFTEPTTWANSAWISLVTALRLSQRKKAMSSGL